MAKITITVDSEEESVEVSIDGNSVPNVCDISISAADGNYSSFYVNICANETDESGDLRKHTRYSKATGAAARAQADAASMKAFLIGRGK